MRIYEFHFIDQEGRRPALDFSDCADDGTATREALGQLRHHGSASGVEIYEGRRLVLRLQRPSMRSSSASSTVQDAH